MDDGRGAADLSQLRMASEGETTAQIRSVRNRLREVESTIGQHSNVVVPTEGVLPPLPLPRI